MDSIYDQWAEVYDTVYAYVREDIPFYVGEALDADGPVLELGCGTGRVSLPLAQAGAHVVGVDSSPAMLEVARRKLQKAGPLPGSLSLVQADMRDFSLEQRFDLVIIPFRGFLSLLTVEDQMAALRCIERHLSPHGRLVFNVFVPHPHTLVQEPDIAYHFRDVTDPETGQRLVLWQQASYDNHSQVLTARLIVDVLDDQGTASRRLYRDFQLRYVHRWEMHHLLRACGFEVVDLLGDFSGSPFDEDSTEMVWIASCRRGRMRLTHG